MRRLFVLLLLLAACHGALVPTIGILTSPHLGMQGSTVRASVAQWVESSGARAVFIPYDMNPDKIKQMFHMVNGIIITGDESSPSFNTEPKTIYNLSARFLFNMTKKAESFVTTPLFGIGRGFCLLCLFACGQTPSPSPTPILQIPSFDAPFTLTTPLAFTQMALESYLFGNATYDIINSFATLPMTMHNNIEGITVDSFNANLKLKGFFSVLSTNNYADNTDFINTIESRSELAIFGTHWHPEYNQYHHPIKANKNARVQARSAHALRAVQYVGRRFIAKANENVLANANAHANAVVELQPFQLRTMQTQFLNDELHYIIPQFVNCNELAFPLCRKT